MRASVLIVVLSLNSLFSSVRGSRGCASRFSNLEDIETERDGIVALPTAMGLNFVQWIFPNTHFTCSGNLTGWIFQGAPPFQAIPQLMDLDREGLPEIEVWRNNLDTLTPTTDFHRLHTTSSTTLSQAAVIRNISSMSMVYKYTLVTPFPVEDGDVMGIGLPSNGEEKIRIHFMETQTNNTLSYVVNSSRTRETLFIDLSTVTPESRYIPLVTAVLAMPEGTSSIVLTPTSTLTSLPTPSPTATPMMKPSITPDVSTTTDQPPDFTPTETPDRETPPTGTRSSGVDLSLIIGIIVGLLFILVLILLAVLIAMVTVKRRQNLYDVPKQPQQSDLNNPTYNVHSHTAIADSISKSNTITSNGSYHIYATPSPTFQHQIDTLAESNLDGTLQSHYEFSQDSDPHHVTPHLSPNDDPEYAQPTTATMRPYEVPLSALSTLQANRQAAVTIKNHDYSVLEGGIYVPTEEERQSLSPPSPGGATSSTSTGVFDDSIYSRWSKKYKGRLEEGMFFQQEDTYWKPASSKTALYDQLAKKKYREILRQQIQIIKHLGSGQFGTVNKGLWQSPSGTVDVAVKTLQPLASDTDKVKFLQEAAIMGQFLHPNVVKLYGVVTVGEPVMIVLEFMEKGDLRDYLLSRQLQPGELVPSDLPQLLLKFCREIASGMNYLANKGFVHRDLAARNILVAKDNTCKIGDFGMSRDLEDSNYYITHGGKIPVKWTAPEALHYRRYSTASDVWSYACVMFEIWSLGYKPFEGYTNIQAMQLIGSGYRLPPPPGCPRALYELMIRSWHSDAARRPTFSAIVNMLSHADDQLLSWSKRDKNVHPQSSCLGAPLEVGERLYPDLQDYYVDKSTH